MNTDHLKPKIIVICGPTGIGKTTMAIRVAETFTGEIVGADSMQIYRKMDIGTAKPTIDETSRITHHMIDVADPNDFFDAAGYVQMARPCVRKLIQNNVLPVVAGGTGLYIKALLHGLSKAAVADPAVKSRLKKEAETCGSDFLHERLTDCDPIAARRIHPNDSFRIIRALEVYEITGRPMSSVQATHQFGDNPFDALKIGLFMDRAALYARIDQRVEDMIADGLIEEVQGLLDSGYDPETKAMQSIGYRHITAYLAGQIDKIEAIRTLKRDTRRYAKRQLTWFKADRDMVWLAPDDWAAIHGRVRSFLGCINEVAANHSQV